VLRWASILSDNIRYDHQGYRVLDLTLCQIPAPNRRKNWQRSSASDDRNLSNDVDLIAQGPPPCGG
jgi:hypothetical protein